jgi:glutathione reductase (NADPH)
MPESFDLVVIGTGSAAGTVASRCREAGWSVAVVDSRPFGGTCALRGCDPKKVLVGVADLMDWIQRMEGHGLRREGAHIEWTELMRFKRTFTDPVPQARADGFAQAGITAISGRARFIGRETLTVGERELRAGHVVIAAGAKPGPLPMAGAEQVVTSDAFLELEALPKEIVFVGGGYISFEFAHLAARAGAKVTILHRGARPLERFDADLVARLVEASRAVGIEVRVGTVVRGIEQRGAAFAVKTEEPGGAVREWEADLVVHGAGRVPDIDDLGLGAAGIERTPRGVKVNGFLQSVSHPRAYAAGDAADSGGLPLTPVAGYEGRIVAANLLEGNQQAPNYDGVPSAVFTLPPLAAVGLTEEQARQRGLRFRVNHQDGKRWYSSRRVAEQFADYKVLVEEPSDRILGAHLLGPHVDELVNVFALAIRQGITAAALRQTVFAYPTRASDVPYML